jgi:hypothetical protein
VKNLRSVLVALVLLPLAAGCGLVGSGTEAPTPTPTAAEPTTPPPPTDAATPEPTVTLMPTSPPTPTPSEEPEPTTTIEGTVLRVSPSARVITLQEPVQGFDAVALTDASEILSAEGQAATLDDVLPGMALEATGTPGQAGALLADRVHLLESVERIAFAPEATSAIATGRLEPGDSRLYVVRASADQTMRVSVVPPADQLLLGIRAADGTVLKTGADGAPSWLGRLPATQDYVIEVASVGEAVDYQLGIVIPVRIAFDAGETSATLGGHLGQDDIHHYVLWAAAGQTMEVAVSAPERPVGLTIVGADGIPLKRYVDEQPTWRGELPVTQDYFLEVVSIEETDYELSVSIYPLSAEPSIEVVSPGPGETWVEGETYDIVWRSTNVGEVDIAVALGGKDKGLIAQAVHAPAGLYSWTIPDGFVSGFGVAESPGRVMVSDSSDRTISDENDGEFTISAPRIQFRPGATSAIVDVRPGAWYALEAMAGQGFYAALGAPVPVGLEVVGGDLWLQSGGVPFAALPSLPETRDYLIHPGAAHGDATWRLRVAVEPVGASPPSIAFDAGATSTTIQGTLTPGGDHAGFTLRASAGQTLAVEVRPADWGGGIWVGAGGGAIATASYGEGPLIVTLPMTGELFIALLTPPGAPAVDYAMTVRITP